MTGEVRVLNRAQFLDSDSYDLGVSAQCVGTANGTSTPAQLVHVEVDDVNPQFFYDPYIVEVPEDSAANTV